MFKQLWMSGILVAFLAFGIKAGLGIGSRVYSRTVPAKKKVIFLGAGFFVYLLLFLSLYVLVTRLNLMNYLDQLASLLQYGMWVHLGVAAGLLLWGVRLMVRPPEHQDGSMLGAGLLLVLPCPVCATVILLNLTLALSLSSLSGFSTTLVLFGLFMGIIAFTLGALFFRRNQMATGPLFLGASMALISLYFFLTVIIAPLYPEIKAAFAMAVSNQKASPPDLPSTLALAGISLGLASIGFFRTYFTHFNKGDLD